LTGWQRLCIFQKRHHSDVHFYTGKDENLI